MYYYFFDRYYGHDRVAQAVPEWVCAWDFFEARGFGYVLCLWDSVSRVEQYNYPALDLTDAEIIMIAPSAMSKQSLVLLHRFTHHWFCPYKKAIPLWISDAGQRAKRVPKSKRSKKKNDQSLIVFPNLRSLTHYTNTHDLDERLILHSQSTIKQKSEAYWSIRSWSTQHLACTYSQIFQDRSQLREITLVDQHTRYYKSQQDPRYHTWVVLDEMSTIFGSRLEKTWLSL